MSSEHLPLFATIVPSDQLHPNYIACLHDSAEGPRNVLLEWSRGFQDRDGKFVQEFQRSFNSSFWELYLFACLKEQKYEISFPKPSPDFLVRSNNNEAYIEAATAGHAKNSTPEHDLSSIMNDGAAPSIRTIAGNSVERLSGTLLAKCKKFREIYKKHGEVANCPFIVALAPFDQPMAWAQNDLAIRLVLYGYEDSLYENQRDGTRLIYGHRYRYEWNKTNGAKIPLGLFVQDITPEISGLLFSNTATFGKVRCLSAPKPFGMVAHARYNPHGLHPRQLVTRLVYYHEELLDGLHLYLNPRAEKPVPSWLFDHPRVSVQTIDTTLGLIDDSAPDGFLINRMVQVLLGAPARLKRRNVEMDSIKKAIAIYLYESRGATISEIVHGLGMTAEGLASPMRSMLSRRDIVRVGNGSNAKYRLRVPPTAPA